MSGTSFLLWRKSVAHRHCSHTVAMARGVSSRGGGCIVVVPSVGGDSLHILEWAHLGQQANGCIAFL